MLEHINSPVDVKKLLASDLKTLAEEIRTVIIETVTKNSGHLASNLGVVELTIALHRIFADVDTIVFDTSHQTYTHKLLTGRYAQFHTLRTSGGLSGFSEPAESKHDPLVIGHAGTGPSMALGLATAKKLVGEGYVVGVIGDGALTSGLAYEGLSNIVAENPKNLMIILNDNGMSISENVGWVAQWRDRWLPQLRDQLELDQDFQTWERVSESLAGKFPLGPLVLSLGKGLKQTIQRAIVPIGAFWDEMGFHYLGPVDGHDIDQVAEVISGARQITDRVPLVHVLTHKGRGYEPAESDPVSYHQPGSPLTAPTYSKVFCDTLEQIMQADPRVVAISAAMLDGTGLMALKSTFPDRVFDAGVCEQHAVSMAAAMAAGGLRPVVCIYSTFLQRAFDQIMHDVGINDLPVVFGVDRAGIVGQDGKTHHGLYDLAYMRMASNMIVSVPKDENEMRHLLYTALRQDHPFAIRYPRGVGMGVELNRLHDIPVGTVEIVNPGDDICIIAAGPQVNEALIAATALESENISCEVVNARFIKPLDEQWLRNAELRFGDILVVEDASSIGGLRSAILEGRTDSRVHGISAGDTLLEHAAAGEIRQRVGLTSAGIADAVRLIWK